jgi:uncharacterized protein YqgC (DUF456 family)
VCTRRRPAGPSSQRCELSLLGAAAVGVVIATGLVGIVVPVLPGTVLVAGAIVVWAVIESGVTAWVTCGIALAALGAAQTLKYAVPGRRLRVEGVPATTLLTAAALGVVGFFVIPVVGLVVGFVAGVYLAEFLRVQDAARAWTSTVVALRAVGLSIAIELAGGLVAAAVWLIGVLAIGM